MVGGRMSMLRAVAILLAVARIAPAAPLAESISVSGDSISRGFDANTSSCNYNDNVQRNWATGEDHGTNFCSSGGNPFVRATERLMLASAPDPRCISGRS
jgi:hypothetical protein